MANKKELSIATLKTTHAKISWLMKNTGDAPLSQVALAEQVAVTPVWINNIVRGKRKPSDSLLQRIADFFGVSAISLWDDRRKKAVGI
jgi:ribosome-binding protein aMBF1 (putative translation factor)